MADFTVDPALMAKGQSLVQTASSEVKSILNTLQGDVEELLPGWQSAGATAFTTAHASWTEKARTIASALDDLGIKLGVVGTTTSKGDTHVSGSFGTFAV
jgi:WXG100 family type VII secretion target